MRSGGCGMGSPPVHGTPAAILSCSLADARSRSLARVQGIEADLGLKGNNFNTAISVLFCGYILGQLPSNLVLSRVRPSLYLSIMCVLWGIVSAATAAANNFGHLVAVRFFLGVLESPFFPGALFLLSSWYTKKELAFRTSIVSAPRGKEQAGRADADPHSSTAARTSPARSQASSRPAYKKA